MALFDSARPNPAGFRDVSAADVTLPAQGFHIVDVREPAEFVGELGHIPGAALVPLAGVTAQAISWNKDEPVLDRLSYNGGPQERGVHVHDFLISCEVEATAGSGTFACRLTDGTDALSA